MEVKRESVFLASIRSFCKVLAGCLGLFVALFVAGVLLFSSSRTQSASDKTQPIIAADAEGGRALLSDTVPVILRLNIHGVIGPKELTAQAVQTQLLDSREGTLGKDRVKAVLLHIDSPGGSAFDSYEIYRSLIEYKAKYHVPIYAYVSGMCASGGMMIACSADRIFSAPVGVIGSVGVLMGPNFNVAGLMGKWGIQQLTITEGKDKDMLSPFRPWQAGEDQSLREIIASNYELFVSLVTEARPRLSREKLVNEYGAQVYDPAMAQEYGYIDAGNSSYREALLELVKEAKIEGAYQVIELKVLHPVLSNLIEGRSPLFSGVLKHELALPGTLGLEGAGRPLYLYSPILQGKESHAVTP